MEASVRFVITRIAIMIIILTGVDICSKHQCGVDVTVAKAYDGAAEFVVQRASANGLGQGVSRKQC